LVADTIYKWLTGEKGYFDTRVVYVAESGAADRKIKRLAIMDQDGANHSYLTSGRNLVLTPRFSPSRQEITYMSYAGRRPRVRILNVDTNQDETLGPIDGMTFAPRFSPDGEKLLFSAEQRGNSDVFVLDLRSRKRVRLTNHPAIDTSPSFSPNQREVVFNSDRGGSPQLYVMASDGTNARRISFGGGRYATPVWSPRGDLIAFTKIEGGRFGIGVMRSDGSNERMLSQSYFEESPTWAPNGRVIMFFRRTPTDRQGRGGKSRLFIVDVAGGEPREIKTPGDASDPAWSPLSP
jgi:TolB protein